MFFSYGRDDSEVLVRQIKEDLEARGHDVWFDTEQVKHGDDWRDSITEGILLSHKVVLFLSKYSMRTSGVCIDEAGIALGLKGGCIQTILVEDESEVKIPPSISHIQWLDMHDWKERHTKNEASYKRWYGEKLAEIVRVLESQESQWFKGEISTLKTLLKPVKSDTRMAGLLKKPFVGRKWIDSSVKEWRRNMGNSRLFWVMGDPGVGKSAYMAHSAHYGTAQIAAVHFCEWNKPDHRDARQVVRNIAFQLATRFPDYRRILMTLPDMGTLSAKDHNELFAYLLAAPLQQAIDGGRERYLIAIDALDEATENKRNLLAEMLAQNVDRLPSWLGIIVSSRIEDEVETPLKGLHQLQPFIIRTESEENRDDIREYLTDRLPDQVQGSNIISCVEQILEKSGGNFLYVEYICSELKNNNLSLDGLSKFPMGLRGIYAQYFQRQYPDISDYQENVRPILGAIAAAQEPFELRLLRQIFDWSEYQYNEFLVSAGSMLKEIDGRIQPFHKSVIDWITDKNQAGRHYYVSLVDGHKCLAGWAWRQYQQFGAHGLPRYFILYLETHLDRAERKQDIHSLRQDFEYLLSFAQACRYSGRISEAIKFYEEVMIPAQFDNPTRLAETYSEMANTFRYAGQYRRAASLRKKHTLPYYREKELWLEWSVELGKVNDLTSHHGHYGTALRVYREELFPRLMALFHDCMMEPEKKNRVQGVLARQYGKVADIYAIKGAYTKAIDWYNRAIESLHETRDDLECNRSIIDNHANRLSILMDMGAFDEVDGLCRNQLLQNRHRHACPKEYAKVMMMYAGVKLERGDLAGARAILEDEVMPRFTHVGIEREIAICHGYLADICEYEGDYERSLAIRNDEQMRRLEVLEDFHQLLSVRSQIANGLLLARRDFGTARRTLNDVIAKSRHAGMRPIYGISLRRLARLEMTADSDSGAALPLLHKALIIFRKINSPWQVAKTIYSVAQYYRLRGNHAVCQQHCHRDDCLGVFQQIRANIMLARVHSLLDSASPKH